VRVCGADVACVQELIEEIQDEKRMFAGVRLTPAEQARAALMEKLLGIAQEIKRSHESQAEERYQMPQAYDKSAGGLSEREKLLKTRYKCAAAHL
jgi:hypothetical protein